MTTGSDDTLSLIEQIGSMGKNKKQTLASRKFALLKERRKAVEEDELGADEERIKTYEGGMTEF